MSDSVSPVTLWAAHKAVLWRKLIQIASHIKWEHRVDIEGLDRELHSLCAAHKRCLDKVLSHHTLFLKILANRLLSFINAYVHKEQVGLIAGRQGPNQIG